MGADGIFGISFTVHIISYLVIALWNIFLSYQTTQRSNHPIHLSNSSPHDSGANDGNRVYRHRISASSAPLRENE